MSIPVMLLQRADAIVVNGTALKSSSNVIHILHVDDDPAILEVSKQILVMTGNFDIDHALSVDEAFKKIRTGKYDVVLSDFEMPEKDGLEFLKELRSQKNNIPFILFTGKGREEIAVKALNLGADGYYNKQGDPEAVYGELTHGIAKTVEFWRARKNAESTLEELSRKLKCLKSARMETARSLRESEERYRSLFEQCPLPVGITAMDGTVIEVNKALLTLTGYSLEETRCLNAACLYENQEDRKRIVKKALLDGSVTDFYTRVKRKDGGIIDIAMNMSVIHTKGKSFLLTIAQDITERKRAEENLKNLKAFDERVINSLGDALFIIDPDDYRIISINDSALKQLKVKREEVIGKKCFEVTHKRSTPCEAPEDICPIREVLETGKPITVEHVHYNEDGEERIIEVSAHPVRNPEGKVVMIHVDRDITERKWMERRVQQAERRYHALFDQAPLGVLIIDPETGIPVEFNGEAHKQLGYTKEEFSKLSIFDYKVNTSPKEILDLLAKILREGKIEFEAKHKTKHGEVRDVVITSHPIELSDKKFIQSIYRDVTEAKKTEYALTESEAKYRMLVELAQEGVWALNCDNETIYINPRIVEMLGYEESEMIGENFIEFLDKPDADLALQHLESCTLGERNLCEFVLIRKDGTRIYTSMAASPIKDDNGQRIGTIALVSDVSERKKAEDKLKESYERMEIMAEKLRVVGGLTRHDVRNKLSAVNGYAYLIKKRHPDYPDIIDGLTKIEQSIREISRIFDFAKMYEQLGVEELTYIEVDRAINEAVALFSGLTLKVVNDCRGLVVLADSFLRQMFYNFLDNTRKYGAKAKTVRISFGKRENDGLRLIYEDDGVGIPVENKSKLFREGFSTGGSTGFGLFLSKKMMDIYGWEIQENGESGKGARFEITIPRINKKGQMSYQFF